MLARFARGADFDCFLLAGRYTLIDPMGLKDPRSTGACVTSPWAPL